MVPAQSSIADHVCLLDRPDLRILEGLPLRVESCREPAVDTPVAVGTVHR